MPGTSLRGSWWATVHGIVKSWTWLSEETTTTVILAVGHSTTAKVTNRVTIPLLPRLSLINGKDILCWELSVWIWMEMIVWGLQFYKKPLGLNKESFRDLGEQGHFQRSPSLNGVPGMSPLMICLGSLENSQRVSFFFLLKIQLLWELSSAFRDQAGGWTCLVRVLGNYS